MPLSATAPPRNKLLRALPPEDFFHIRPLLEGSPLKQRRILHHSKLPIEHVYFVEEGLVSVVADTTDRTHGVGAWLIGSEGIAGVPVILGAETSPHKRMVQVEGDALRMRTADLRQAMEEMPSLRGVLLRYVNSLLVQASQSSACHAQHRVQQRLACWLLMARDRLDRDDLPLTHEIIAHVLGTRRASVTEKLAELEGVGAVAAERRHIRVLDRPKLEALSCGCYRILRGSYDCVLIDLPPSRQRMNQGTAVATQKPDLSGRLGVSGQREESHGRNA